MKQAGLSAPDLIIADGQLHRFQNDGDHSRNSWYILFNDDLPAGKFGCWKLGISSTWTAEKRQNIDPVILAAHQKKIEDEKQRRKKILQAKQAKCRAWCVAKWKISPPAPPDHPYLLRKGVQSYGLKTIYGLLLLPMCDGNGNIHGMQFISAEGDKRFKKNSDKMGHFYPIGDAVQNVILICEGYATGASLYEATGYAVAIAFDAGNIAKVAEEIKKEYPKHKILICAENDQWNKENPGLNYAKHAAAKTGASVVYPRFKNLSKKPTDFNDLHALEGIEAVKEQLAPHIAKLSQEGKC